LDRQFEQLEREKGDLLYKGVGSKAYDPVPLLEMVRLSTMEPTDAKESIPK